MSSAHRSRAAQCSLCSPGRTVGPPQPAAGCRIQLYGWDSPTRTWHGPSEISLSDSPSQRLTEALRAVPGRSWYGPVTCCTSGEPASRFFTLLHDLSDCAVAVIYCDESKTGPAEIVAVIPAGRRPGLRPEFAFEFLAFAHFLGALDAAAELQVHDAIAQAIAEAADGDTLAFSISSGLWPGDLDHVLSGCVEKVVVALCQWLHESSAAPPPSGSVLSAG